jgi:hypothetical protein
VTANILVPEIEALTGASKHIIFLENGFNDLDYILVIYGDHLPKHKES